MDGEKQSKNIQGLQLAKQMLADFEFEECHQLVLRCLGTWFHSPSLEPMLDHQGWSLAPGSFTILVILGLTETLKVVKVSHRPPRVGSVSRQSMP